MIAFTGQSRGAEWCQRLVDADLGECTLRGELPPRRAPWFYDPGSFRDWVEAGQPIGEASMDVPFAFAQFARDMRAIRLWSDPAGPGVPGWPDDRHLLPLPHFILLPDRVAAGEASLAFSESFLEGGQHETHFAPGAPLYVAVQDGMEVATVAALLCQRRLDGIFVGGTMEWKLRTGAQWARIAQRLGKGCHIGRAMTRDRVAWAKRVGASSIDGNAPNWSSDGLERFQRFRREQPQLAFA